ncbi:hypothetical protein [Pseudoduganella umbonata]|uniref:Putative nucleic-acid-binding Zn-ribbon protein n=1 Tax=Pseudoduganella umbonata TaxID=864828 RepID=A0A4V1EE39_9BURK|nr:hypothetical protein [Pseudoduganella umbonata]MBB3224468.1 putative nucleic-acid-binding Zn-ribbon protein [Pseudoduganella umbonata]QCP13241.1 hypothetical protein FCL38_24540 [Pseudoduganella umbonata]
MRCTKPVPKAGRLVGEQAVCPSCVPYFKDKEHCAQCGAESSRLSTMPSAGIDVKICESCRNQYTHKTCSVCRKYRKVSAIIDGRAYCNGCHVDPGVSHACPTCASLVFGAGQSRCRACTNEEAIQREVALSQHVFEHAWAGDVWNAFGTWLYQRDPGKPRLLHVLRSHQPFFERVDANFQSSAELTGVALLRLFGTAQCRKHLLPIQFLQQSHGVVLATQEKTQSAESDRIASILVQARREPWVGVLDAYSEHLAAAGLATRTSRMYLAAAASVLRELGVIDQPWPHSTLEGYLAKHPGAKNNVSRFVTFCREVLRWDVRLAEPAPLVRPLDDPARSVSKLAKSLRKAEAVGVAKASKRLVVTVLVTALGVSEKRFQSLNASNFERQAGAITLRLDAEQILLPPELVPYAERLMVLNEGTHDTEPV